jgi:hypothetical protein
VLLTAIPLCISLSLSRSHTRTPVAYPLSLFIILHSLSFSLFKYFFPLFIFLAPPGRRRFRFVPSSGRRASKTARLRLRRAGQSSNTCNAATNWQRGEVGWGGGGCFLKAGFARAPSSRPACTPPSSSLSLARS